MDNCDGKQARKLGLSSPLGMSFDHGVDSFICITGSIILNLMLKFHGFKSLFTYYIAA